MSKLYERQLEEIRVSESESGPRIEGYAVKWNSLSGDLGGWREQFERGAFTESLASDDIRVQWQHDKRYVFGRVKSGTAQVWEDDIGLGFRADPPDAQWARDALESIRRGDIDQNSFKFGVKEGGVEWDMVDGERVRTVTSAFLREVGPQTEPAYEDTEVALREFNEYMAEREQPEPEPTGPDAETVARQIRAKRRVAV